jgi:hypothetical protein
VVAVVHFTILALVGQQSHDFGIRLGTGKDYLGCVPEEFVEASFGISLET